MRLALKYCIIPLLLMACHKRVHVLQHTARYYTVNNAVSDTSLTRMLQPYKNHMDTQMQVEIGYTDTILYKGQPECTLGNFIADAIFRAAGVTGTKVDAAVFNYGGIRLPYISAGVITIGKVYELMPFDNMLTVIDIPGDTLIHFCNHMASYGGWPVSGMSYTITGNSATNILINNIPVQRGKMYKIATNDYLATGGDNCFFLVGLDRTASNIFIRDVLLDEIRSLAKLNKPLHPYIYKRVTNAR